MLRATTLGPLGIGALSLYMVVVMGFAVGANTGYMAESPAEAHIEYNGTHVTDHSTGETDNITYNFSKNKTTEPILGVTPPEVNVSYPGDQLIQSGVQDFARSVARTSFTVAFAVADVSAWAFYRLQWLPQIVISSLLNLLGLIPLFGIGLVAIQRFRRYR
jgi:hypothetical protein